MPQSVAESGLTADSEACSAQVSAVNSQATALIPCFGTSEEAHERRRKAQASRKRLPWSAGRLSLPRREGDNRAKTGHTRVLNVTPLPLVSGSLPS